MSQTEQALARLREMIFSGELPPASNHFEADLAAQLGMSRTPIREAALTLQAQGLVDVQPRRGLWVRPVSAEDMAHIYDVLGELECLAAQRAAEKGYSATELQPLSDAIAMMQNSLIAGDRGTWAEADDAFHAELVRLGGNPFTAEIRAKYTDRVRRVRLMTLQLRPLPTRSNEDHANLLKAIAEHDPPRAKRIHHAHCAATKEMMVGLIRSSGLRAL